MTQWRFRNYHFSKIGMGWPPPGVTYPDVPRFEIWPFSERGPYESLDVYIDNHVARFLNGWGDPEWDNDSLEEDSEIEDVEIWDDGGYNYEWIKRIINSRYDNLSWIYDRKFTLESAIILLHIIGMNKTAFSKLPKAAGVEDCSDLLLRWRSVVEYVIISAIKETVEYEMDCMR